MRESFANLISCKFIIMRIRKLTITTFKVDINWKPALVNGWIGIERKETEEKANTVCLSKQQGYIIKSLKTNGRRNKHHSERVMIIYSYAFKIGKGSPNVFFLIFFIFLKECLNLLTHQPWSRKQFMSLAVVMNRRLHGEERYILFVLANMRQFHASLLGCQYVMILLL